MGRGDQAAAVLPKMKKSVLFPFGHGMGGGGGGNGLPKRKTTEYYKVTI